MMALAQWGFALVAALCCGAYVCRFDVLVARRHRLGFVALHVGLGAATFAAMLHGLQLHADLQDLCTVVASVAWVKVSAEEWAAGPPPVAISSYADLDSPHQLQPMDMRWPSGGSKPPGAPQP